VTNLAPASYRGRYHGMYTLMWSIGMLLGPSFGTLLFQRNANVYWSTIACAGVLGASLAMVRRRRRDVSGVEELGRAGGI